MRIQRLQIRNVGRHRDLDIDLGTGGLAVVRGPNEAGKTTVQRAIEIALTRRCTTAGADVEGLRTWNGADEERPEVTMDFVEEELEASRPGRLEKSFRGQRGTVRLELDGEVVTDPTRADEILAELTGIPTEAFFRSTASIRHHEIAGLDRDEAALRDRLQASISGADRGTSAAKKRLDRALRDLRMRGDRNPGRLRIAEEAVARAQTIVDKGEAELALLEHDRNALAEARQGRRTAEATAAESRAMLEKARQAERFAAERDAATERFERYREAVKTAEEIARLSDTHPSSHPLPVIRQLVERLRVLELEIATLQATLGEAVDVDFELVVPAPSWKRWAALAMLLSVGAVGLAAIALRADALAQLPVFGGIILVALVAVLLAGYAVRQRRASGDFKRAKQLRDDQIARRLRGRSQLELELREKETDRTRQLAQLGTPSLAEAETLLAAEEQHTAAIDRLQARLEGYVGYQPTNSLPGLRDRAALEIEQKTAALAALGPIANEPRARERLEVEVQRDGAAVEASRDEEANARARVEANTVDAEQLAGEVERLEAWREQLGVLERRVRVYETTLAAIEHAEVATMRTATRYLEKRMVGDIARITGGRYRRVRVDDQTLDISVFAPEKGDWVPATQLSQGTADQVYLAARLGLVRLVTGDRRPPLILDDPFVTFDDDRARESVALLRELAADFQVIYLTTTDRFDDIADVVVELPRPEARDEATDVEAELEAAEAERAFVMRRDALAQSNGHADESEVLVDALETPAPTAAEASAEMVSEGGPIESPADSTGGAAKPWRVTAEMSAAEAPAEASDAAPQPWWMASRTFVTDAVAPPEPVREPEPVAAAEPVAEPEPEPEPESALGEPSTGASPGSGSAEAGRPDSSLSRER